MEKDCDKIKELLSLLYNYVVSHTESKTDDDDYKQFQMEQILKQWNLNN